MLINGLSLRTVTADCRLQNTNLFIKRSLTRLRYRDTIRPVLIASFKLDVKVRRKTSSPEINQALVNRLIFSFFQSVWMTVVGGIFLRVIYCVALRNGIVKGFVNISNQIRLPDIIANARINTSRAFHHFVNILAPIQVELHAHPSHSLSIITKWRPVLFIHALYAVVAYGQIARPTVHRAVADGEVPFLAAIWCSASAAVELLGRLCHHLVIRNLFELFSSRGFCHLHQPPLITALP